MATTTERGYGWQHQRLRAALLAQLVPGSPCPRCHKPMWPGVQALDLGHVDGSNKTAYLGILHATCNRRDGARLANQRRGRDGSTTRRRRRWRGWPPPEEPPSPRSRQW